jgi:hypothetical protein
MLAYGIVRMHVADDPVHVACNVAATDVAHDRAVFGSESVGPLRQPVMVLYDRLDSAIPGQVNADLLQLLTRIAKKLEVILDRVLPEMEMEGLLSEVNVIVRTGQLFCVASSLRFRKVHWWPS